MYLKNKVAGVTGVANNLDMVCAKEGTRVAIADFNLELANA